MYPKEKGSCAFVAVERTTTGEGGMLLEKGGTVEGDMRGPHDLSW